MLASCARVKLPLFLMLLDVSLLGLCMVVASYVYPYYDLDGLVSFFL